MADYDVGSAALQIVPSFKGVVEQISARAKQWGTAAGEAFAGSFNDRVRAQTRNAPLGPGQPESTKQGERSAGAFADGFKRRVEAALKSLPDVKINADSSETDRKIAFIRGQLEELSGKRIGIDVGEDQALAQLAVLKRDLDELGARTPSIQVAVDAGRASAELAAVQAEVARLDGETATVNVRADTSQAEAGISGVGSLLAGLAPALIPLGGALLLGGAGAGAGLAAGTAGVGALALGLSGITGAVKATTAARQASAKAAVISGASEVSSANQVKAAEQSLAEARANADQQAITAAEQVKNARQSLVTTERDVTAAQTQASERVAQAQQQERLASDQLAAAVRAQNLAREQATRDLQDYANAAADSNLAAQQAALDLTAAQAALAAAQSNPATTAEQLQQAQLDVARAQQAVAEANQQAQRSAEDNTKAQDAGVKGDAGVVAAAKQVAAARRQQRDATRELRDAQIAQRNETIAGAEQITRAEQGVSDALRAQSNQQRQSAFAISQAEAQVASAMQSGTTASSALTAANLAQQQAFAKLTPEGRSFARFIIGTLEPALTKIKAVAQANLLPGLESGIKAVLPVLPGFSRFVGDVASEVGHLADEAGHAFTDPFWTKFFGFVGRVASPTLDKFAHILGNITTGIAGLVEAAYPGINDLGRALVRATGHFADFGKNAGQNSGFQAFLRYSRDALPVVGRTLEDVAVAIGHIVAAVAPFGLDLLKGLDGLARLIGDLPPGVLEAIAIGITSIVVGSRALSVVMKGIGALGAVAEGGPLAWIAVGAAAAVIGLVALYHHSKAFHDFIDQHVLPIVHQLVGYFQHTIGPILSHIANDVLSGLRGAFHDVANEIEANKGPLTGLFDAFKKVADFVVQHVFPILGPLLKGEIRLMGKEIALGIKVIGLLWEAWAHGINFGIHILNAFIRVLDKILGPFGVHIDTLPTIDVNGSSGDSSGAGGGGGGLPRFTGKADGGMLGSVGGIGGGFVTAGPHAIVGEGNPNHPEYVIPTDPAYRDRALSLFQSLGGQLLQAGGVVGRVGGFARDLAADGAVKALEIAEAPVRALIGTMPATFIKDWVNGIVDHVNKHVVDLLKGSGATATGGPTTGSQVDYAREILGVSRDRGITAQGTLIALMAGLVESGGLRNLANTNVPESLTYPHDGVGSDHYSMGIFQMQGGPFGTYWGTVAQLMNPMYTMGRFFQELVRKVPNYASVDPGYAAQTVEVSAFPDRYDAELGTAKSLLSKVLFDNGGEIPPGITTVLNGTGRPEHLLTDRQWSDISQLAIGGANAALLGQILDAVKDTAPAVTEGVVGGFERAASTHARTTQTMSRKP